MTLQQALIYLTEGHKIKLPEWTGYWFIPTHLAESVTALMNSKVVVMDGVDLHLHIAPYIRVLTKDGDILDTPWIRAYSDRQDWETTEGKLGFDFAIRAMKNGKLVVNKDWDNPTAIWLDTTPVGLLKDNSKIASCPVNIIKSYKLSSIGEYQIGFVDMISDSWTLINPDGVYPLN
jgi:hypothetical protein